jgi:hypothetical protein
VGERWGQGGQRQSGASGAGNGRAGRVGRATADWQPAQRRQPVHRSPRRIGRRGGGESGRWFRRWTGSWRLGGAGRGRRQTGGRARRRQPVHRSPRRISGRGGGEREVVPGPGWLLEAGWGPGVRGWVRDGCRKGFVRNRVAGRAHALESGADARRGGGARPAERGAGPALVPHHGETSRRSWRQRRGAQGLERGA